MKPTIKRKKKVTPWRSGLEEEFAAYLTALQLPFTFESDKLEYTIPATKHKYTPDFKLKPKFYLEAKGIFDTADRKKHLLIKEQHPDVDIRIVFHNPNNKLRRGSPTTYAMWCDKHGIKWADFRKGVPQEWIKEIKDE